MPDITIDELKHQWERDPIWDIEDSEGFEDHRDELLAFRLQKEQEWRDESERLLRDKAERLGIPDNLTLARYIETLEYNLIRLEGRIAHLEDR